MKPQSIFGLVLIVVGVLILVFQGFSYTKRTNVIDAGPIKVDAQNQETVPISPIIGVVVLGAGIFVLVLGTRRS